MNKNKKSAVKKLTQEELQRDLKNDRIIDREINDTANYHRIKAIMDRIEFLRSRQQEDYPELTQKELAKRAGIGHSTYKDYLSGTSDNIKLKTLMNIAHVLRCELSDLIDE